MKLRVWPIVIALFSTSILLFGGWFVYRSYAIENPLIHILKDNQGVQEARSNIMKDAVLINLKLGNDANLREIQNRVISDAATIIGSRNIQMKVESQTSDELNDWWSRVLFEVAQAMETKHFSTIPKVLQDRSVELEGLQVWTEMDEKNVYVRLVKGESSKYIILPRIPSMLGAWPNE